MGKYVFTTVIIFYCIIFYLYRKSILILYRKNTVVVINTVHNCITVNEITVLVL